MSSIPPDQGPASQSYASHLGIKEKLQRMRDETAAKKEAARIARTQSNPSSARSSVSMHTDSQRASSLSGGAPLSSAFGHQQQPPAPVPQALPSLTWVSNTQPISPSFSHVTPHINWNGPPAYSMNRGPSAGSQLGSLQPLSPTTLSGSGTQGSRPVPSVASPSSQGQSRLHVQPSGLSMPRPGTNTPEVIPDKLAYQVQEEPERLEVQPALISTELPLPMRAPQSVPHTPVTPSRLSLHEEASRTQTETLKPRNLGSMEFIVPLCMQKRILKQYVDTIEYYPNSIKEIMKEQSLSEQSIEKLNQLLCRLANVSTHIGLEGGGPSSQDSVRSDQEAAYAEMSSEKFKFLGILLNLLRGDDLHIAVVAEPGPLHDILELFLKGKRIHYNRPNTYSKSTLGHGKLHVSIIASREEGETLHLTRAADLVVALDETFKAENETILNLRRRGTSVSYLTPVIRPLVYSSVEHLDLCLPRTLDPIKRLRKLISCAWHTQSLVGELLDEPTTQDSGESVSSFIRSGGIPKFWSLPKIRPIENIPVMDSDSSLSDYMSDVSVKVGKPSEMKFWPNRVSAAVNSMSVQTSSAGKRPFDLDYGDSFETQAKKQKMAKKFHAGKPLDEPRTVENLERLLKEAQRREQELLRERSIQQETIISFKNGAERRQRAYEELRDKCSSLHQEKNDLTDANAKLKKDLERARDDKLSLQGERGRLNKEIEDLRQELLKHPNPDIAQKAREDATIRELTAQNAALKKKIDFSSTQFEYMKEQYRDASERAVILAAETDELKKKIEPLEGCLQHERDRRKHERENNPRKPLIDEINQLKEELRRKENSTDKIIMRKEKEIEDLKRGRNAGVQTRGSSAQPRSPRGGSRGVSPAPGLLGAPTGSAGGAAGGGKGPSGLNRPLILDE